MKAKKFDLLERTFYLSYDLPWLTLIRRRGFYWIHAQTINEMGDKHFAHLMHLHNLKISRINNHLNILKITQNGN